MTSRAQTSKSNATHVYLHTTDLNTEGTFGCEVSLEEPSFQSIKAEADLRIYGRYVLRPVGIWTPF